MTIPRLNGWWDEIAGNATKLAGQLPEVFQPNNVAQKRLQDMVQQNPMLMEQFTNMDDATRAQLAQSLGFKGQNPLAGLPVGAQRMGREEQQRAVKSLTPEQATERTANLAGVTPQRDLLRKQKVEEQQDQKFEWEKALAPIEIGIKGMDKEVKSMLLDEQKRALKTIEDARAKYPNVNMGKVVSDIMTNRVGPDTQGMLTVISADEGLKDAMKTIIDIQQTNSKYSKEFQLRSAGQQDDMARVAVQAVESARKEYDAASKGISAVTAKNALAKLSNEEAFAADPTLKLQYDEAIARRDEAYNRYKAYSPVVEKVFKITIPPLPELPAPAAGSTVNPVETPEARKERLRKIARGG